MFNCEVVVGYNTRGSSMDSGRKSVGKKWDNKTKKWRRAEKLIDLTWNSVKTAAHWNNLNTFNPVWRWDFRLRLCFSVWQFHWCIWQRQVCKHVVHSSTLVFSLVNHVYRNCTVIQWCSVTNYSSFHHNHLSNIKNLILLRIKFRNT